jgi:predicted DsbA family dithiol-disulfide isomerase
LEALFAGRGIDIPAMLQKLKVTADSLGLPFGRRTHTYNSQRAQALGKWAEHQGRGQAFHHQVFHAYFALGRNIAQTQVLLDIAEQAGLQRQAAAKALEQEVYKQAVTADWQRSHDLGVTAVPSFFYKNRLLVGAHPYAVLESFIKEGTVSNRP